MSLNIKDPQIHQLARELASLTGESMTQAIGEAVKDRLKSVRNARRKKRMSVEEMLALGKRVRSKMKGPLVDHAELLYDDRGLPK
jgi:antitoxin VapB